VQGIGHLGQLSSLNFFGVKLGLLPTGVRRLTGLNSLSVAITELTELPSWISELKGLTSLNCYLNQLDRLPESIVGLSNLSNIDISNNFFAQLPKVLLKMPSLRSIRLRADHDHAKLIRDIPKEILESHLDRLDLEHQPIEVPPPEVAAKGVQAIKNYWRQQQEVGVDYLCEAKLLIVGEAGAGKTSLAKKIQDSAYQLRPTEASTEGIEITRWNFKAAIRVRQDGREDLIKRNFQVNTWDFGGQEVYHATHQFFLTHRSLYALVVDDRKEDTDFNYWLNIVELLSDASPLLIVQNEKQDRRRDIDIGTLRARFSNLMGAYRVNLATNRGLDEVKEVIRQQLQHLPHIGVALPRTWKDVREALERDPRNYIGIEEYLAMCQDQGFTRIEDKLQLSGYLHDLGICLHFQDDPVLKHTLILKPRWGTDAAYRVLDNPLVIGSRGRFNSEDLARIWPEQEYASMRQELLRLMMRFQLCYELPRGLAYIAPQLLSPSQPAYDWQHNGNLAVRYEYDFMPKGLITLLIVSLNHLIASEGLVWKAGVILCRDGTRAEVIEDYAKRRILVRVAGPDTRGLLAIIDDQLDRIHRSFPRLRCERFLPCNCHVCSTRDDPFVYPFSELKDFALTGDAIQCRASRKLVDAATLIRDVFPTPQKQSLWQEGLTARATAEESPPRKEVFVSYCWTTESSTIVDRLQQELAPFGINVIRDKDGVKYKESIRAFMRMLGQGKAIIVVLSKAYLESKNCMFELTEIAERKDLTDRIFPIVFPDAKIHDASSRLDYIRFWEAKKTELDAKMKLVSGENLQGIREELDLFSKIRSTIAGLVDILADMNTLSIEQHQDSSFHELIKALEKRLSE
jgi:GTPase SAR1 family protein